MLRAMTENEPVEQQEEVISGEDKEDRSERNRRLYREELDAWNDHNDTVTEAEIVSAFCRENVRYVTALSRADCTG